MEESKPLESLLSIVRRQALGGSSQFLTTPNRMGLQRGITDPSLGLPKPCYMIRGYHCFCGQRPATLLLQNRSPHRALGHVTPEEAFSGKKPYIGHFRIFGCIAYSYVPKEKRTKLEPTAEKGIFVGYSETSKAFRIYIPTQRKVVVRRDVKFEEDRALRRSQELAYLDQPDPQQQLSQSQGSSGQGSGGSRGTSITVASPSVSSGSQSQRGGALGSM